MKSIFVTQPALPPLEDFIPYLERIWESRVLTNGGPLHQELEAELCRYLGVPYISLFNNGTIALIAALRVSELKGEVITTPYTFIATANSIVWNGLKPVFVDVDPATCNIDPMQIEAAITPETSAILAVHCYGRPCDVEAIEAIAARHGLQVIYDAAHAFGVQCHCGQSVLNHGDLSVLSFHATKVFNTFEGGAIVSHTAEMKARIDRLKNFGYESLELINTVGLNGKMSEVQAALGLLQLQYIDRYIERRAQLAAHYRRQLGSLPELTMLSKHSPQVSNHGYFPVFFATSGLRKEVCDELAKHDVIARRYFWPLVTDFQAFAGAECHALDHAQRLADVVVCLPLYPDLEMTEVDRIVDSVRTAVLRHLSTKLANEEGARS